MNLNPAQGNVTIGAVNDLGSAARARINTEVVDVLFTDLISELSSGAPDASPTIAKALMALYMTWRNKRVEKGSETEVYNNAGSVIAKAVTTDDGTQFTKEKFGAP